MELISDSHSTKSKEVILKVLQKSYKNKNKRNLKVLKKSYKRKKQKGPLQ